MSKTDKLGAMIERSRNIGRGTMYAPFYVVYQLIAACINYGEPCGKCPYRDWCDEVHI